MQNFPRVFWEFTFVSLSLVASLITDVCWVTGAILYDWSRYSEWGDIFGWDGVEEEIWDDDITVDAFRKSL